MLADLQEKKLPIKAGEDIVEPIFLVDWPRKQENDLVDAWVQNEILKKLFNGCDEKQEVVMRKMLENLNTTIGAENAFLLLSRCYQFVLTLKEKHSSVSMIGYKIQNAEKLFKAQLSRFTTRNPKYLSYNLAQASFDKKLVRKHFLEKLEQKQLQIARWKLFSSLARYILFAGTAHLCCHL